MINFFKKILSFFAEIVVYNTGSEINGDIEVTWIDGRKTLNVDDANYSFGVLYDAFDEAFQKIKITDQPIKKVLILGYAAGSAASLLRKKCNFKGVIHGVELDNEIINVAKEHFPEGIKAADEIFIDDAFTFVQNNQQQYDLIITDLYINVDIPEKFEGEEFVENLKSMCSPCGMLIFNKIIATTPQKYQAKRFLTLLQNYFACVTELELTVCSENRMFVARIQEENNEGKKL
ncbi:MAG: hypothetical protein U9R32_07445 [Bacteroidota bacterium]|nr:hypothetical protein [Bacteroidota bacterium]